VRDGRFEFKCPYCGGGASFDLSIPGLLGRGDLLGDLIVLGRSRTGYRLYVDDDLVHDCSDDDGGSGDREPVSPQAPADSFEEWLTVDQPPTSN
jgi:hypothetical protein